MAKIYIKTVEPTLRIIPTVHFIFQLIKRAFDLTALIPAYLYVKQNLSILERGVEIEHNVGRSTIVYLVDEDNNISLITGWKGER